MSMGYFDWVPERIGEDCINMAVSIEIDIGKLNERVRKKLRTAVDTGVLPSYSGKLAALYRTLAYHYKWPSPHLWTASGWVGCRFYVSEADFNKDIAPFLAVIAGGDMGPKYERSYSSADYGTLAVKNGTHYYGRSLSSKPTPDAIYAAAKKLDVRDPVGIREVLDIIDTRGKIRITKLIPHS